VAERSAEVIKRYLAEAFAAEKSLESQLQRYTKEAHDESARIFFHEQAVETKRQYERLAYRLHSLGGSPSITKGFLGHIFGSAPKAGQTGHERDERITRNLMSTYAVVNSEIALYEALATMAEAAGDPETVQLARTIQSEKQAAAQKTWKVLPVAALDECQRGSDQRASGCSARTTA
jgi:ferritin-like metal-binding protein YciE